MSGKIQMSNVIPTEDVTKGYYKNARSHINQDDEIYRPTGPDVTYQNNHGYLHHGPPSSRSCSEIDNRPGDTCMSDDYEVVDMMPLDEEDNPTDGLRWTEKIQTVLGGFYRNYKKKLAWSLILLVVMLYMVYFGFAMTRYGDEGSVRLLWITCVVLIFMSFHVIWKMWLNDVFSQSLVWKAIKNHSTKISWVAAGLVFAAIFIFITVDLILTRQPYNLVSLSGVIIYVLLFFIFSKHPNKVRWRPVVWGLALQYVFAVLTLRTQWGLDAFTWLGDRISEFLDHTDSGSRFVFGDLYTNHFFAFKLLPTVIFFSTVISVLYYLGVMQWIIRKLAYVMQTTMDTTAGESLNAAGNIFIGQTEAPLMVRTLLPTMTLSELHAVMTGGFATVAGSAFAAYISMGVPANHLISASVMSAPAALAMSKLFYPETEVSTMKAEDVKTMEQSTESNLIEAASAGATTSIRLVANIAAHLIAFIAMLTVINSTLTWLGVRVGLQPPDYPYLTFELICSYLLYPLAMIMGVELADCRPVAQLIGIKTFFNEFIAYERLSQFILNSRTLDSYNGTISYTKDDIYLVDTNTTLVGGVMSRRSQVISTYALCGFANLSSIGVQLGGLGALAPSRKSDLSKVVVRAMIAGNVACFMTACIAGLFYQGP